MQAAQAERAANAIGAGTLVIGAALVIAPGPATRLLRLAGRQRGIRLIGLADLALAPGLLVGRPRWPWMGGRLALNLAFIGCCVRLIKREGSLGAKIAAVTLVLLSVGDTNVLLTLRRQHR